MYNLAQFVRMSCIQVMHVVVGCVSCMCSPPPPPLPVIRLSPPVGPGLQVAQNQGQGLPLLQTSQIGSMCDNGQTLVIAQKQHARTSCSILYSFFFSSHFIFMMGFSNMLHHFLYNRRKCILLGLVPFTQCACIPHFGTVYILCVTTTMY